LQSRPRLSSPAAATAPAANRTSASQRTPPIEDTCCATARAPSPQRLHTSCRSRSLPPFLPAASPRVPSRRRRWSS